MAKRPRGRPTKYTEALADLICERLANGEPLARICKDADMPGLTAVWEWRQERPAFNERYARAREAQADEMDARILAAAEAVTPETANADRVRIDAYKWRAARLNPPAFGEKVAHVGDKTADPIQVGVVERVIVDTKPKPEKG